MTKKQWCGWTDRRTDGRTDNLRWQYCALHYVHEALKICYDRGRRGVVCWKLRKFISCYRRYFCTNVGKHLRTFNLMILHTLAVVN